MCGCGRRHRGTTPRRPRNLRNAIGCTHPNSERHTKDLPRAVFRVDHESGLQIGARPTQTHQKSEVRFQRSRWAGAIILVVAWNHHPGSSGRGLRGVSHRPSRQFLRKMIFATGVGISMGWRFHAQLWRPMHDRLLELDRFRWQKRDLRQKLALEKPSEGVPCCRIDSLVVGCDANVLHPREGENGPPSLCVPLHGKCCARIPTHRAQRATKPKPGAALACNYDKELREGGYSNNPNPRPVAPPHPGGERWG